MLSIANEVGYGPKEIKMVKLEAKSVRKDSWSKTGHGGSPEGPY